MRNSYLQFEQSNVSWSNFSYSVFISSIQKSTFVFDILKIDNKLKSLTQKNKKWNRRVETLKESIKRWKFIMKKMNSMNVIFSIEFIIYSTYQSFFSTYQSRFSIFQQFQTTFSRISYKSLFSTKFNFSEVHSIASVSSTQNSFIESDTSFTSINKLSFITTLSELTTFFFVTVSIFAVAEHTQ